MRSALFSDATNGKKYVEIVDLVACFLSPGMNSNLSSSVPLFLQGIEQGIYLFLTVDP